MNINYAAMLDALKFLVSQENIQAYEKIADIFTKSVQMILGQTRALSPNDQTDPMVQQMITKYHELSTQVTPVSKKSSYPADPAPEKPSQEKGKKFPGVKESE